MTSPPLLREVFLHCEREAPREAVGVLIAGSGGWVHHPLTNAYDAFHARDPVAWPRSSRSAFLVDPKEWMSLEASLETGGGRVGWLYHSHLDAPAELSTDDQAFSAPGGQPLVRGLRMLVVSVSAGRCCAWRAFSWGGSRYLEAPVEAPGQNHELP